MGYELFKELPLILQFEMFESPNLGEMIRF